MTATEREAVQKLIRAAENILKLTTRADAIPVGVYRQLRGTVRSVKMLLPGGRRN